MFDFDDAVEELREADNSQIDLVAYARALFQTGELLLALAVAVIAGAKDVICGCVPKMARCEVMLAREVVLTFYATH